MSAKDVWVTLLVELSAAQESSPSSVEGSAADAARGGELDVHALPDVECWLNSSNLGIDCKSLNSSNLGIDCESYGSSKGFESSTS